MFQLIPRPPLVFAIGLLVAGAILIALEKDVAAFFVAGLGAILLVALLFYAVGRSEDVERENEAQRRRREHQGD